MHKTAAEWLSCDALALMDRGDHELVESAAAAALAERDFLEFRREQDKQKAGVRVRG